MGDFVEGCACFASFFLQNRHWTMGVKKGCRDNFVMPTLSMTIIRINCKIESHKYFKVKKS